MHFILLYCLRWNKKVVPSELMESIVNWKSCCETFFLFTIKIHKCVIFYRCKMVFHPDAKKIFRDRKIKVFFSHVSLINFWTFLILASIKNYCRDYHSLIGRLETEKIDLEYEVARKDYEARTPFVKHFKIYINQQVSINLTLYDFLESLKHEIMDMITLLL